MVLAVSIINHRCRNLGVSAVSWYVVQTYPNQEIKASVHLRNQSYETYIPMIACDKRVGKDGLEVMFPGYIFVALDLYGTDGLARDNPTPIKYTKGCLKLVAFGDQPPCQVPEGVVEKLQDEASQLAIARNYKPGDSVIVEPGNLFEYCEAIIQEISGERRAWILLEMMGGPHRMQVDVTQIQPA